MTLRRVYFGAYGLASAGMAIADTLFGKRVSEQTGWGHAQGWMTEMACFDVLVAYLCVRAWREPAYTRVVAGGLALLSFLLATHNLAAYFENHGPAHLQGGLVHLVACVVGVIVAKRGQDLPLDT